MVEITGKLSLNGEVDNEVYKPLTEGKENVESKVKRDSLFLYFTAMTVGLTGMAIGSSIMWTSPVMKRLKSLDPEINPLSSPITTYETSILSGLVPFGGILGSIFVEKLHKICGRKNSIILTGMLNTIAYLFLAFGRNVYLFFVARFLLGICISCGLLAMPIYIQEVCESHNRGKISVLNSIFFPIGNLYVCLIGPVFSVRVFSILCAVPGIISILLLIFFLPESPIHLAASGKRRKTVDALKKFRNKCSRNVEEDYLQIQNMLKDSHRDNINFIVLIRDKTFRKAFIIALGVNIFQITTGIVLIMSFMAPIFDEARIGITGDVVAIIAIMVKIIFFFVASQVIEKLGRRPLLLISSLGTCISLTNLGLYFYLKSINFAYLNKIMWLPVGSILMFFMTYALGLGPLPPTVTSELFPSNVSAIAIAKMSILASIFATAMGFGFPIVEDFFGTAYCFWFFAGFCLISFIFTFFCVPETKGKDVMEIQKMLS